MNRRHRNTLALLVLAFAVVAGCKDVKTTPIKSLLDDPSQYEGKTVRVAGTVGESAGILGYGGYRLSDGTGTITIITNSGGAPRTGATVGVEGEFKSAFTLGTESAAVIKEHTRYTPK